MRIRIRTWCWHGLFLTLLATTPVAADEYPAGVSEVSIRSSLDGSQQPALFYMPPDRKSVPLMVALHTWSSDWKNAYNVPLARGCIERGWAFLHPDFRGPNKSPEGCGSELAVADVEDAVAWAVREHGIDADRIYLAGASGGGHMALLMAGRAPQLWAGVSAWVPISDCAGWHAECVAAGRKYANDLELSCGGKPGASASIDAEYQRRSPLTWLADAKRIPVSINAGIRDGHDGSVPISHTLHAFNLLADQDERVTADEIQHFTKTASVPDSLKQPGAAAVPSFGEKQPRWRAHSANAEVTIFNGGHEMIPAAIFEFFSGKKRPAQKPAAANWNVLDGDQRDSLFNYLLGECDRLDEQRRQRLDAAITDNQRLAEHIAGLNRSYRELIGQLPDKTALNPVVIGKLEADGYRVEKVHFESLPKHRVTALLYLPTDGEGPWPAVLFACGHSANGKAHEAYQKACALLARNGFVVLSYDPISQGERTQLPEAPRFGTTTHTLLNVGSRLVGRSVVWYEAWDGMRAIDYLLSRPEVDKTKPVGMTGTSGGGTQTTFLMALDDRIGPAAPSCYIMQRTVKFRSAGGIADGCQHLPGEGLLGIDHIDYALMRAPKPTAILAATRDFFDINSTRVAAEDARRAYATLGVPDRQSLFVADNGHGMHVEHRQEATRWMRQWLHNDATPVVEPALATFTDDQLRVTQSGQVATQFADEVSVAELNLSLAKNLGAQRAAFGKLPLAERQTRVRDLLGLRELTRAIEFRRQGTTNCDGYLIHKLVLERPGDPDMPALLAVPTKTTGSATILISDRDKGSLIDEIGKRAKRGEIVLAPDLRGFGETRDRGSLSKYFNHEHRTANISMHIGRPLVGQRVEDLLTAIDFLSSRNDIDPKKLGVAASGQAAAVANHAAFLDARVAAVSTDTAIASWIKDVVANPLAPNKIGLVVPGALRFYDLPDLHRWSGD